MMMPERVYTNGNDYRYSINGQENTPEIAPNTTTALFWEYDARIGRRWNVDPRPNISVSPYSVFAGNPNANIDINGDTAEFRIFSNEGGNQTFYDGKYYNGNLHDATGKVVDLKTVNQELNSASLKIIRTFNEIRNESVFGKFLIDVVTSHEKSIHFGITDKETGTGDDFIIFNFNQSDWIKTTAGKERVSENYNATIVHEFGHLYGKLNGTFESEKWTDIQIDDQGTLKPITYDELIGMAAENLYRSQMKLPIRTHYSTTNEGVPISKTQIKWDKRKPKIMSTYLFNSLINLYYLYTNPIN